MIFGENSSSLLLVRPHIQFGTELQIASDRQCLALFCDCEIPSRYRMTSQTCDVLSEKFLQNVFV